MARIPRSALVIVVVSLVVLAATVTAAVMLRKSREEAAKPPPATSESSAPPSGMQCGRDRCASVGRQQVGADVVELLADTQGRSGRVRIDGPGGSTVFETTITQSSAAKLTANSLNCVAGPTSGCLVRGTDGAETLGEVFIGRAGGWTRADIPFSSDGTYLALTDVTGDGIAEVVTDQHGCGAGVSVCAKFYAQVFTLSGDTVGCTKVYAAENLLPGWPTVAPTKAQLKPCPQ